MKTSMIFYVAGHSGGHIIPALTHAQRIQSTNSSQLIGFFSSNEPLDRSIIDRCGIHITHIPLSFSKVRIRQWYKYPLFAYQMIRLFFRCLRTLRSHNASSVVSMGGYISIPVCLAAWMLRIPVELYELNVEPGLAVKTLARFAHTVHICFPQTQQFLSVKGTLATYPVRFSATHAIDRVTAAQQLGLDADKKTVLILGGSQGSQWLNKYVQLWVAQLPMAQRAQLQIVHQTGHATEEEVRALYAAYEVSSLVFSYRDDIHYCYSAADLIVSRAGAGALHELLFFEKKSIIIPLETARTAHQVANALAFEQRYPQYFSTMRQADIVVDADVLYLQLSRVLQAP